MNDNLAILRPPRGKWVSPSVGGLPDGEQLALGTEALLRIAQYLHKTGWRVQEVSLRDRYRHPINDDLQTTWQETIVNAIVSNDINVLNQIPQTLPFAISYIRLIKQRGVLILRRTGDVEIHHLDRRQIAEELRGAIDSVWNI